MSDLPQHEGSDDGRGPVRASQFRLGTSYVLVRRISVFLQRERTYSENKNGIKHYRVGDEILQYGERIHTSSF